MKILLIDDDASLTTIFCSALKQAGYETVSAADGTSGIEAAKTQKPDMILLDQVLPDMQGNDVLKALKGDALTKDIPVSLLSNFGQNELIEQAIQMGALDYILKYQIEPADLVTKVKQFEQEKEARKTATD